MNFLFFRDLRENYCRNPDGQEFPWCFTTDPRVRTMSCTNIPQCGTQNKPDGETLESFVCRETMILSTSEADKHLTFYYYYFVFHIRPCNHTYWNDFVSVPMEKCTPIRLWEGLTTMPHINEFWQQLRIIQSHWTMKNAVEGSYWLSFFFFFSAWRRF